ncbi:AMP-binding protein [Candidatus Pelagibacter bacterium]|nr:AMP-binding protein [Candidatus Pelagibacter bacterium]
MLTPQQLLLKSFAKNKKKNAIWSERYISYGRLKSLIDNVSFFLLNSKKKKVCVLATKSIYFYAVVLSIILCKKILVPLNKNFSIKKNLHILKMSEADLIFYDEKSALMAKFFKKKLKNKKIDTLSFKSIFETKIQIKRLNYIKSKMNDIVYILFTSGSTGMPKGVEISNYNLSSYLYELKSRYNFNNNDKFSNNFDITFDLFMHDLFLSFINGACLYLPDKNYYLNPSMFIKKHKLTCWFSVPSLALNMQNLKQLKKNKFPSLKYSAFCGEALPVEVANSWKTSSPKSIIENLYGPTENTIAVMGYRFDKNTKKQSLNDIVPIGKIFKGNYILPSKKKVFELCISGGQVFSGYLKNTRLNKKIFTIFKKKKFYRTGDLVKKNKFNNYCYIGRVDRQIKVRGFRIEPQEVEREIKGFTKSKEVVVVGWPSLNKKDFSYNGLAAFIIKSKTKNTNKIINYLHKNLSVLQTPNKFIFLNKLKYNANGKIDYSWLKNSLKI